LIAVGGEGSTSLFLDSVKGVSQLTTLSLTVVFDPALLRLRKVEALSGSIPQINVDSLAGRIEIRLTGADLRGEVLRFTWLGLLGPSATALVEVTDISTSPETQASVRRGRVELVDCFGLAGNVTVGRIAVGMIRPQPVNDEILLPVQSPAVRSATILVRDLTGRQSGSLVVELREGLHIVRIPTSDLPAGGYWIELHSAGSLEVLRFWK
jgi:hypothetical protein